MKLENIKKYGFNSYISLLLISLVFIQLMIQVDISMAKKIEKRAFKSKNLTRNKSKKINTKLSQFNIPFQSQIPPQSSYDFTNFNKNIVNENEFYKRGNSFWENTKRINNLNDGGFYQRQNIPFNDSFTFKKIHDCDEICLFRVRELDCTNGVYAKSSDVGRKLECACKNTEKELNFFIQNDFCYSIKGCTIKSFFKQCNRILNLQ